MARVVILLVLVVLTAHRVTPQNDVQPERPSIPKPQIYQLNVRTDIRSRYARTLVTSRLANPADRAQEVTFQVTIPESAFVSKFVMEVDGEFMEGNVRERVQAKQEYQHAVQSGQSAGHVATATIRDASEVRISVNVGAQAKASFNLTYEELLVRRKGRYELAINLNPGQVVREMAVDVYIQENFNITDLKVPAFRSTNEIALDDSQPDNTEAVIDWVSGQQAHVHFAPTEEKQQLLGAATKGLGGQFIVQYDVDRQSGAGEVLALDGYFVHFFSPPELQPLNKHVIFVLDVSGSMNGRKMEQLREAMDAILQELRPGDYFNLIDFSYSVTLIDLESAVNSTIIQPPNDMWGPNDEDEIQKPNRFASLPTQVKAFPANTEYITKAREAVKKMSAGGGTNIHDAVFSALHVAKTAVNYNGSDTPLPEPLIIFLTDGEATVGETRADKILELTKDTIPEENGVPLFSLAFGHDADLAFLKRLSLRSGAFARKIYEAADAALQLRDFYRQVASPLLSNVTFNYSDTQVDGSSVTKKNFGVLFSGSEIVVAGKLREANQDTLLQGGVEGLAGSESLRYSLHNDILPIPGSPPATPSPQPGDKFLERLWAFLSIKQLLDKYEASREDDVKAQDNPAVQAKNKALELALKFSFVTPVTSLVVVKNDSTPSTNVKTSESNSVVAPESLPPTYLSTGVSFASGAFAAAAPASHNYANLQATSFGAAGYAPVRRQPAFSARPVAGLGAVPAIPTSLSTSTSTSPDAVFAHESLDYGQEQSLDSDVVLQEKMDTTESNVRHFNFTLVDFSEITWLKDAPNEPSGESWKSVFVGNSTTPQKLLHANQSVPESDQNTCTNYMSGPPSHCRPLISCVVADIVSDEDIFNRYFSCNIGTEKYLGICCPDSVFQAPSTPVVTTEESPAESTNPPLTSSPAA